MKRLPKGHRFVKQQDYKRGHFYNWACYTIDGFLLSICGKTKADCRRWALRQN